MGRRASLDDVRLVVLPPRGRREHHQAVMAHADWLIDLGPGAGQDGGRVVFTGTPADLLAHGGSLTARHLRTYLEPAP